MKAVDPRVSFAELQQWPDDRFRYELYDGEVIVVPAPFPRHQRVAGNIEDVLRDYEHASGGLVLLSPIDVVLSEHDVVQPDVVFIRKERRHLIDMMQAIYVPPDLAVEVLSRSTEARDRGRKMRLLARFGVPEYWIVDPVANTLEIYANVSGGFVLGDTFDGSAPFDSPLILSPSKDERFAQDRPSRAQVTSPTLPGLRFDAGRIFEE